MTDLTDERIQKILNQYERKRVKEKERYERIKDTDEFKSQNRNRAKTHYEKNKESKKLKYIENKEFMSARSSFAYYKRLDRLEEFKTKFPEKVKLLNERNINID